MIILARKMPSLDADKLRKMTIAAILAPTGRLPWKNPLNIHKNLNSADYWRKHAEEIRALKLGENEECQEKLEEIARAYDELARRAHERLKN